jgi:O-acetyl-ADP-ribose deacetylase (regulator of RNase III)
MTRKEINGATIELVRGNIVHQDVDAIVNAANSRLAPGGGVAGAIHRAAGPELWEACKKLGGCKTGEAKITAGYKLKAKYVIHTVGPIYRGSADDPKLLASCYRNCLQLAVENNIDSIAFPALSTGAFGYPMDAAAKVAFSTVITFLRTHKKPKLVRFVLFSQHDFDVHAEVLNTIE